MANVTGRPLLGMALQEIRGDCGGLVVLGVALMLTGANLFVATSASILYIGAMILAGGVVELVDAFTVAGWQGKSLRLLAGAIYGFAGAIVVLDPLLASVGLWPVLGTLLCFVGALRIGFGLHHRDGKRPRLDRCRGDIHAWRWYCRARRLALDQPLVAWRHSHRRPDLPGRELRHAGPGHKGSPPALKSGPWKRESASGGTGSSLPPDRKSAQS